MLRELNKVEQRYEAVMAVQVDGLEVFTDVIQEYLRRVEYADDGYAALIHVPAYRHAQVVADPYRSFGAPTFERGGARVDDVLQRFWSGESIDELSAEFGVRPTTRGRPACRIQTGCLTSS